MQLALQARPSIPGRPQEHAPTIHDTVTRLCRPVYSRGWACPCPGVDGWPRLPPSPRAAARARPYYTRYAELACLLYVGMGLAPILYTLALPSSLARAHLTH